MSDDRRLDEDRPPTPRCPLCGKPRVHRYRPFCSVRCRDVDLGRWFDASYAVPAVEPSDEEDER